MTSRRKYNSNAERQRAYRERQKAKGEQHQDADGLSQEDRAALVAVLTRYRKLPVKREMREEIDRLLNVLGGTPGRQKGAPDDLARLPGEFPLL